MKMENYTKDIYTESVIPISATQQDKRIKYILIGLLCLSAVILLHSILIGLIAVIVCTFILYRHLSRISGEYEYVHTNDIFDVDIVICNSTRKQLCSIQLNSVDLIARADSDEISIYGQVPEKDYSGDLSSQTLYAMVYNANGRPQKLLLQLDKQMHQSLKQWMPEKVK